MGAVNHQTQAAEAVFPGQGGLAKFHVASGRIIKAGCLAQFRGLYRCHRLCQGCLNGQFQIIRQLGTAARKEFDAIVVVGVVGGANNNANRSILAAGHHGNCGGRQGTQQLHIHAGRDQTRFQR